MVTNRYRPSESVTHRPAPEKFGSSGAGWSSTACWYRPAALACQISISVSGTGRPPLSSTRPVTMIRSPSGSPACWVVRSASAGVDPLRPEQRPGDLGQPVRQQHQRLPRRAAARWTGSPAKSSGGCTPPGRSYDGRASPAADAAVSRACSSRLACLRCRQLALDRPAAPRRAVSSVPDGGRRALRRTAGDGQLPAGLGPDVRRRTPRGTRPVRVSSHGRRVRLAGRRGR